MSTSLLKVKGLAKNFAASSKVSGRFRALMQILASGQAPQGTPVLEDIDFEVLQGQSLAIIGGNGAGKSTLLKLITGVLAPSEGTIEVNGTTAALLELGAGFDPEYTGLENLHMNAAFLGLSRHEIAHRLDDILAFADIGDAIHEPVKHYSSGMIVRLGFAVVAVVKPDLLITDEVLAVGDESFQKKCIRWIEQYLDGGGTLLMVSHNMYQVQKLCKHAIWLDDGTIRRQGDVFDVTQRYLAWHERKDAKTLSGVGKKSSSSQYAITTLSIYESPDDQNSSGTDTTIKSSSEELVLDIGQSLSVSVVIKSPDARAPVVLIGLVRADGTPVYGVATDHDDHMVEMADDGQVQLICQFPNLPLLPGGYRVRAHTLDPEGLRVHDTMECALTIRGQTRELGMVRLTHHWRSL